MKLPEISRARPPRIVVIGDVMLDHYLWGSCDRVSPEAPVQVVNVSGETFCPGGAANVVANLAALGVRAEMIGVVGQDDAQQQLRSAMDSRGVGSSGLITTSTRPTTVKRRVLAGSQQVVRLDHETATPLPSELETLLIDRAAEMISDAAVVLLSDYGKGVLTERVTRDVIRLARARRVPVLVDPKGRDYTKYTGATLVTPNRSEAALATGIQLRTHDGVRQAGRMLREKYALEAAIITLSEDGVALFEADQETILPTETREVFDVTGAGDTFVAALAVSLAAGQSLLDGCRFANAAAGVAVGKVGAATVTLQEVARASSRIGGAVAKIVDVTQLRHHVGELREARKRLVFTNGCFDILHAGHVRYLEQAAALGDALIVGVNDDASVKRLKGPQRPINPLDDRALVLATLAPVSYVVSFAEDTPLELIRQVQPDVLVKGGDYRADDVVGAQLVRERGGAVRILPLLEGRSTTRLIERLGDRTE